jgi:hypothetical protein
MDALKTAVSFITFQRFYRYVLKRLLAGIFLPDLRLDQIDVQLFRGEIQLTEVSLNIAEINRTLKNSNTPFRLVNGRISRLRVRIPWRKLMTDPSKVLISSLHIRARLESDANTTDPFTAGDQSNRRVAESTAALVELVGQMLLRVEGCIDKVVVELENGTGSVFEARNIVIRSAESKIKGISIDSCEVRVGRSCENIATLSPLIVRLDLSDFNSVRVGVKLTSLFIKCSRPRSIQAVTDILKDIREALVKSESGFMFQSVVEGELLERRTTNGRKWYEEIYEVIEGEVLRSSNEADEFFEAIDEVLEVPKSLPKSLDSLSFEFVSLDVGRVKLALLGVEPGSPGASIVINDICLSYSKRGPSLELSAKNYGLYLDLAQRNESMFVSTMSVVAEDDQASSVYESVVDSEESVGISELDDESEEDISMEEDRPQNLQLATDALERERIFFDDSLGASHLGFLEIEERFPFNTEPGGVPILIPKQNDPAKSAIRILHNGDTGKNTVVSITEESLVMLSPEIIANLSLIGRVISESIGETAIDETAIKTEVSGLTVISPGIAVRFDLGNGHILRIESRGELRLMNGKGFVPNIHLFAGESEAAILRDIQIWMSRTSDRGSTSSETFFTSSYRREEELWTAVGGQVKRTSLPHESPTAPEDQPRNVWEQVVPRELSLHVSAIQIVENPGTFLDLQLKVMSLIDQIGMASLGKPTSGEMFAMDVNVDTVSVHRIELKNACMRFVNASGAGPLMGIRVQKVLVPSLITTVEGSRNAIDVNVDISGPGPVSQICVNVGVGCLHCKFGPDLIDPYLDLVEFFVPPIDIAPLHAAPLITAPPRPTVTVVNVTVSDSFVAYPHGAVFTIDGFGISSGLLSSVDSSTPIGVSFTCAKLGLWLAKRESSDWDFTRNEDMLTNLRQRGYVSLISIGKAKGFLERRPGSRISLAVSAGTIRGDLRADTYDGLCVFLNLLKQDLVSLKPSSLEPSPLKRMDLPPFSQPIAAAPRFVIKEDFVQSKGGRGGSRFGTRKPTSSVDINTSVGARWLVDPNSVHVIHDHLTNREQTEKRRLVEARKEIEVHAQAISSVLETYSVNIESVRIFIHSGSDWEGSDYHLAGMLGRGHRIKQSLDDKKSFVCVELDGLGLDIARSSKDAVANINVAVSDVRIRDAVVGSVYQHLVSQYGLRIGNESFSLKISRRDQGASKGEVSVAPICITLDQDTLDFVTNFVNKVSFLAFKRTGETETDIDIDSDNFDESSTPSPGEGTEMTAKPKSTVERLFQSFQVSAIHVELNYKSKRLSLSKLRRGDSLQLLNVLPLLEGLKVNLCEVKMVDIGSVQDVSNRLLTAWSRDINKAQILKSLSSVKPLKSFSNLSNSVSDLVRQPLRQIRKKDGKVSRGILRGLTSFVRTLAIESLNLADVVVSSAQNALEFVDAATCSSPAERIECDLENDDEEEEDMDSWVPVEQGARERALDPASAIEGLKTGSESLLRGVNVTFSKGAPGFILQPAIGAAEAVSVVIRGARSAVDSGRSHAETERKYKGPYVHSELLKGT